MTQVPDHRGHTPLRKLLHAGLVTATALGVTLASVAAADSAAHAEPATGSNLTNTQINNTLDTMARALAVAMVNEPLRHSIHDQAAQRFDGDTEVLWKSLATQPGVLNTVAKAYGGALSVAQPDALTSISRLADSIPKLQVAVPKMLDTWNPTSYTPLVAYVPEGVEDTTLKTVTAYDTAGTPHSLNAQVAPTQPVIVLGLNERTDEAGNLLQEQSTQPDVQPNAATSYEVNVTEAIVWNAHEPWVKGDAEISLRALSRGCTGAHYENHNMPYLNHDGDYYVPNPRLYMGHSKCDVIFFWWEDDSSGFDFTLAYGPFSLGVKMSNSDDLIGGIQLPHSSFKGSSSAGGDYWPGQISMWTD